MTIASAYNTDIGNGDVVRITTDGSIIKETGTTTITGTVGIFLGCSYTDATYGFVNRQNWVANTVATDAVAFIADDPDLLFKVALVSGTTVIAGLGKTVIGTNLALVQNAVNTTTGDSTVGALTTSSATTISLPLRCIAVVPETATGSDTYVEIICKWNAPYFTLTEGTPNTINWLGGHQYLNPLGT